MIVLLTAGRSMAGRKSDDLAQTICAWTKPVKGWRQPQEGARQGAERGFAAGSPAGRACNRINI
jgi:hypothetical protein